MYLPDSRIQKLRFQFPSVNGKCREETYTSKLVVIKYRLYLENVFYCFLTQKHCSFREAYKTGFIMIFVRVHVTFKSGNASKLLFFILTPPIKNSSQKCTHWDNFNQNYTKACVSNNCIDRFVFLFSLK